MKPVKSATKFLNDREIRMLMFIHDQYRDIEKRLKELPEVQKYYSESEECFFNLGFMKAKLNVDMENYVEATSTAWGAFCSFVPGTEAFKLRGIVGDTLKLFNRQLGILNDMYVYKTNKKSQAYQAYLNINPENSEIIKKEPGIIIQEITENKDYEYKSPLLRRNKTPQKTGDVSEETNINLNRYKMT